MNDIFLENGHCPPGYFGITEKCFWFICGSDNPSGAEAKCSKDFGSLASLHPNSMHIVGEYLSRIQIRSIHITHITIGLSRIGQKWIWTDGSVFNDSRGILGYHNNVALLTWNATAKAWTLMGTKIVLALSLHLCERNRGMFLHVSTLQ